MSHTVAQRMSEEQVRRLPVLDADERLVGIVSLGDLARETPARPQSRRSKASAPRAASTSNNRSLRNGAPSASA